MIRRARPRRGRLPATLPLLLVALHAWPAAACHRPAPAADLTLDWTLAPSPPVVGPAVLTLRCVDGDGRPVRGATLRVEGHMSHPGMAPVLATATERDEGTYEAELELTMRGDWILLVSGSLPNGETLDRRIEVPNVRSPE